MRWHFLIPLLVIPLLVPSAADALQTPSATQSADAYAVYSVLISDITSLRQKKFLISADTVTYTDTKSRFKVEPENLESREEFDRRIAGAISSEEVKILRSEPCVLAPDSERQAYLSAMVDYRRKNETSKSLERKLVLPEPYELVNVKALAPDDWTGRANAKEADGLFEVSAVGFSSDMTVAIVYIGFDCPLCGRWALHVLKKTDGKWKQVATGCDRMS